MRTLLAWCGAIVTVALAVTALVTATYVAERCFVSTGGFGGCEHFSLTFAEMLARFPLQLIGPLTLLVAVSVAAVVAAALAGARPNARVIGGGFTAAHAVLALPMAQALPQPLFAAVPLLAAAYAGSLLDLLLAAVLIAVAWVVGTVTLETLYRFVGPIYGFLSVAQSYWSFAAALGIGAGAIAAATGRRLPMTRALCGAFLVAGGAVLIGHIPLERYFYPSGVYENPGGPGVFVVAFWIALPNLVLGPLALRVFLGAPWRATFAGTLLAFAGAAVAIAMPLVAMAFLRPSGG